MTALEAQVAEIVSAANELDAGLDLLLDHARKGDGAHRAFGTTERALSVAYTPTHCAGVTA